MTKHILFPFLIFTWKKIFIFLNVGLHWPCNAVHFGPQVSCTCTHVKLEVSPVLSLQRKVRYTERRLHAAAPENINDEACLLPCTSYYMYNMPNVSFEISFSPTLW